MMDVASDLKQRFGWAMDLCLESYEVLPDGMSFERSDRDEYAIGVFENLRDTVDGIPLPMLEAAEKLRASAPKEFDDILQRNIGAVGLQFSPANATEFVEVLNESLQANLV